MLGIERPTASRKEQEEKVKNKFSGVKKKETEEPFEKTAEA